MGLIESLNQEQKLFIKSFMANYADFDFNRQELVEILNNTNITDLYIKCSKENVRKMFHN